MLVVEDHGQQFVDEDDVPDFDQDVHYTEYEVDDELMLGLAIPWHNLIVIRKNDGGDSPLHYHQSKRRGKGQNAPPPIRPQDRGSHWSFKSIKFSVQVQSCRRAMPT